MLWIIVIVVINEMIVVVTMTVAVALCEVMISVYNVLLKATNDSVYMPRLSSRYINQSNPVGNLLIKENTR